MRARVYSAQDGEYGMDFARAAAQIWNNRKKVILKWKHCILMRIKLNGTSEKTAQRLSVKIPQG